MKTLSVKQPWASMIARGEKTIEVRSWRTSYRGPLLIVSCARPRDPLAGLALAIVQLIDCRPWCAEDERLSGICGSENCWSWLLRDARLIPPFPGRGRLGLYDIMCPATSPQDLDPSHPPRTQTPRSND